MRIAEAQDSKPDHVRAFWIWSLIGAVTAGILLIAQTMSVGGVTGLIQVGEESPLRTVIEEQLGEVPLTAGVGHDGQIFYAQGLDLVGDDIGQYFIDPAYRYRRILFPAASSLFGLLDGHALLVGMIVVVVLSAALASGSVAATATLIGRSELLGLSVILNPGVWLSVRLLTPEVMGTALMALGLLAYALRRTASHHVAFSLSALSKEAFILTPLGLGVSRNKKQWLVAVVPAAVLLAWTLWGQINIGGLEGEANNLEIPFVGIFEAVDWWHLGGWNNWFYLIFAFAVTAVALLLGLFRRGWLRWSLLGWAALAICASWYVWRIGNNPARVFGPMLVLIALHGRLPDGHESSPTAVTAGARTEPATNEVAIDE